MGSGTWFATIALVCVGWYILSKPHALNSSDGNIHATDSNAGEIENDNVNPPVHDILQEAEEVNAPERQRPVHHVEMEEIRDAGFDYDNDDRARRALEDRMNENQVENRINAWKQKGTVGVKKAKSLAKKDQRRAYNEYLRQLGDDQRERIRIEEEQFGDLFAEEREERERLNELAKAKLDQMNEEKRRTQEEERLAVKKRYEQISETLENKGICTLKGTEEDLRIASGISETLILDDQKHVVKVTERLLNEMSEILTTRGEVSFKDLKKICTKCY